MNMHLILEVHFHQEDEVSLFLESNQTDRSQLFAEILLFCSFCIKQLVNLGPHEITNDVANALSQAVPGTLHLFAFHHSPKGARLVDYKGSPGRKLFRAELNMTLDSIRFDLKPKGFFFFIRGLGYYAPQSIFALLKYLAKRRISDPQYLERLELSARLCGQAFLAGKTTLGGQSKLVQTLALEAAQEYLKSPKAIDPLWSKFSSRQNDAHTLREKALAFSPLLVEWTIHLCESVKELFESFPALGGKCEDSGVLRECVVANMHVMDRIAFMILGQEKYVSFADPLIYDTIERFGSAIKDQEAAQDWKRAICVLYNQRISEYSKLDLFPVPNEKGGYNVSNTVGYGFATNIGCVDGVLVEHLFSGHNTEMVKETQLRKLLVGN